jgi:hypothetical protein
MLDGGGSGGGSGTNWNGADVPAMWSAVANQETSVHWDLLSGWQKSYELTLQHLGRVKSYRDNLAAAWPPEKSPASAAYLERLDVLITHLQGTYDAAVANHTAFSGATWALADSRRELKKIYDEYVANQGKIEAHNAAMSSEHSGGLAGQAAKQQPPPVSNDRQQQLTWQARALMFTLSGELAQAQTAITKPPRYEPTLTISTDRERDGGNAYVPPAFPPLFPTDAESRPTRSAAVGSGPGTVATPAGPLGLIGPAGAGAGSGNPGLVLGGTGQVPVAPPGHPSVGIGPPPPAIPSPGNAINPPVPLPGVPPGAGPLTMPAPPTGATNNSTTARPGGAGAPPSGMRPMPVGGVIGGMPGAGLGQPATGGRAAQHINPVGGVIAPSGAGARPAGGVIGAGGIQPGMPVGGRPSAHGGRSEESSRWDPGNPWRTDEGVSPVVVPAAEQRIDPGPAIGFDR